jgi:MinD superfamily P-loop ATPase
MNIAIASGKGGTGKTTLSTNLAVYLAEQGKVVLVDLDVEEPNSGLFLSGKQVHTEEKYKMIPEWIAGQCSLCGSCREVCYFNAVTQLSDTIMIFPQLCHSCYACSELCPENALPMKKRRIGILRHMENAGLSFVESILDIGEEQAVPLIAQTIRYVNEHFQNIAIRIFDSPPGTSCPMIEAVKHSDFVILVTEPTPVGLYDLSLAVETVRELKKDFAVVLNRYGMGNADVEDYCRKERIPLIAKIPHQRRIAEYCSRGELLYRHVKEFKYALDSIISHLGILPGNTGGRL